MIPRRTSDPGHPGLPAYALLLTLALLFLHPAVSRAEGKVGFIDPVRVLAESRLGKLAKRDLARARLEKEKALQRSQEKLAALESGVPLPTPNGPPAPASAEAIAAQRDAATRLRSEIGQDLDQEGKVLLSVVVGHVDRILIDLAKRQGFSIVLKDPDAVAFVAEGYDLTDEVIRILDQGN